MIQEKLNPYWSSTINSIDIDFKTHSIIINAELNYQGQITNVNFLFEEVSGHYFDYFAYKKDDGEIALWDDVIELAEIHYLPELNNKNTSNFLLHTVKFNFLIEIYASKLFIKANQLFINNERIL